MTNTINQRGGDATADLGVDPVEVGDNASASGADAVSVGVGAQAQTNESIALGDGTVVDTRTGVVHHGARDLLFGNGQGVTFPQDAGSQTVADIPITSNAPQGEEHSIRFTVAGTEVFEIYAEADGVGGVQNLDINIPDSLSVTNDIETASLTGETVTIEDSNGNTVATLDGSQNPAALQLEGNNVDALKKIIAEGSELQVDGDVTISGSLTEGATL